MKKASKMSEIWASRAKLEKSKSCMLCMPDLALFFVLGVAYRKAHVATRLESWMRCHLNKIASVLLLPAQISGNCNTPTPTPPHPHTGVAANESSIDHWSKRELQESGKVSVGTFFRIGNSDYNIFDKRMKSSFCTDKHIKSIFWL